MTPVATMKRDLARYSTALSLFNRGDAKQAHEALQISGLKDEQAGWGCYRRLQHAWSCARTRRISQSDIKLAEKVLTDYAKANPELAKRL